MNGDAAVLRESKDPVLKSCYAPRSSRDTRARLAGMSASCWRGRCGAATEGGASCFPETAQQPEIPVS